MKQALLLGAIVVTTLSGVACSGSSTGNNPPKPSTGGSGGSGATGNSTSGGASPSGGGSTFGGSSGASSSNAGAGQGGATTSGGAGGMADPGGAPGAAPDFGPNVLIFDPSMSMQTIQGQLDAIATKEDTGSAQFTNARYAYFFKPGAYQLDVKLAFYMQAIGLGQSPDDVQITGAVRSKADWLSPPQNATLNFWRSAENLQVTPTLDSNAEVWAVSQGASFRRMHIKGPMNLSEGGFASGGFVADSQIDGSVASGSQQQFFVRNTSWTGWTGGVWNMVFSGVSGAPAGAWPGKPYTVVDKTPLIREKPFLYFDGAGHYFVMVPGTKSDTQGAGWTPTAAAGTAISTDKFYVAKPGTDTAATINAALSAGQHLLLTPGIYQLEDSIHVTRADTIVFGLGLATLVPTKGTPALTIADVDGVKVSGIIIDAGPMNSTTLLQFGPDGSTQAHSQDPSALQDISCRVGGEFAGTATSCVTINSSNVIGDNLWMWRADHGTGAGWTSNISKNGLIVNGNDVTIYGLFVEHFQEYQTLWNGNGGRVYFYQSEMPYDPPSQADWQHGAVNGYASYKVADSVTTHEAWGIGVYCAFRSAVVSDNAIETPTGTGIAMHHLVTSWLNGTAGSAINHLINGTGDAATNANHQVLSAN
jgi:hypothetical protein